MTHFAYSTSPYLCIAWPNQFLKLTAKLLFKIQMKGLFKWTLYLEMNCIKQYLISFPSPKCGYLICFRKARLDIFHLHQAILVCTIQIRVDICRPSNLLKGLQSLVSVPNTPLFVWTTVLLDHHPLRISRGDLRHATASTSSLVVIAGLNVTVWMFGRAVMLYCECAWSEWQIHIWFNISWRVSKNANGWIMALSFIVFVKVFIWVHGSSQVHNYCRFTFILYELL